jgi:hypothetical protein
VRAARPQDYLKIIAAVMPTRTEIEKVVPKRRMEDLTDDELMAIIEKSQLAILNAGDTQNDRTGFSVSWRETANVEAQGRHSLFEAEGAC